MRPKEKEEVAAHQHRRFNELVEVFDTPQPTHVMERLSQIVSAAGLRQGEVVLDVGTGVGVLIPLIRSYRPSAILAGDLAEKMLQRLWEKYPEVRTYHADIALVTLDSASIDVIFMNALYGNITDKPNACANAVRMLRPGGRLVVSHPELRAFVDQLRVTTDLFIESLPTREEFQALVRPLGVEVMTFRDEPKLYLMVARKKRSTGDSDSKEQINERGDEKTRRDVDRRWNAYLPN
jgi:ubiquinone/menaquinone biosynthesis C-methylase UbiE